MINFILIFVCISVGVVLSKSRILPADAHKSINAWVLYIALPALSLRFVPEIEWNIHLLLPVLTPLLVWTGAWLFVSIYDRRRRLSAGSRTALLVTCGLGNTAFIGFPMIAAFFGESEIHHAVVVDQVTFILFATVAVVAILRTSSEKSKDIGFLFVLKKVFRFPPFIACLLALIFPRFIDISAANPLLDKLVATMSPMALFSVGLQLKPGAIKDEWRLVSAGLVYKLVLAPFLAFLLALLLHSSDNQARVSVFEAGMSSHITVSLLAAQHNLNPKYCSLVVGLGIIFSFFTLTGWYFLSAYL
ncbi:MAG: AEC family transporter [Dysgonamonadaceae bacterium]|jgi:predicted permease|nr:AEC family transporter [Dysgonamonadaceae bacterium]